MIKIQSKREVFFLNIVIWILTVLMLFLIVACGQTTPEEIKIDDAEIVETETDETINFVGSVSVQPLSAPVGDTIIISGTGLPANQSLDLVWNTFEGSYNIQGKQMEEYHGRIFDNIKYTISSIQTDTEGGFQETITVPEDYGFNHNITIEKEGEVINRVGFHIETTASIDQTSGPQGTLITIIMEGIGTQSMENSWTVMYDNKFTGVMTAVTTNGTAKAIIPATGGLGKHIIRILHGAFQYPYLNTQQSPQPDRPMFTLEFTITEGGPVLPPPIEDQKFSIKNGSSPISEASEPVLWIDPVEGNVALEATLQGNGFSPGENVLFNWFSVSGNRVSGTGWEENLVELGTATVDENGSLSYDFIIPDDLGGGHRITAIIDGTAVATTDFTIKPSAFPLEVSSGPAGTQLTININGVGWTETANIYTLVYDNAYLGYACGFNSQGEIIVYLPLTGEPGWHFIDLYPAIYKGKEMGGTQNFRIPQLTYQEDHPGEQLPAFHFAVQVTE